MFEVFQQIRNAGKDEVPPSNASPRQNYDQNLYAQTS